MHFDHQTLNGLIGADRFCRRSVFWAVFSAFLVPRLKTAFFFMKGEREPGRTRAYRRPRYMFIVPSVATSARHTCRNQYGTRTRIHDSLIGEFDGVLFNCLLKVPDNFLHTVSMQSVSFPWAV